MKANSKNERSRPILKISEVDLTNPYHKKCKYRLCLEFFEAARPNEDYCCDLHRNREKAARFREENLLSKEPKSLMLINDRILKHFYLSGRREIGEDELMKLGFSRLAPSLKIEHARTGGYVIKFLQYGIREIRSHVFVIVDTKDSRLNTK